MLARSLHACYPPRARGAHGIPCFAPACLGRAIYVVMDLAQRARCRPPTEQLQAWLASVGGAKEMITGMDMRSGVQRVNILAISDEAANLTHAALKEFCERFDEVRYQADSLYTTHARCFSTWTYPAVSNPWVLAPWGG